MSSELVKLVRLTSHDREDVIANLSIASQGFDSGLIIRMSVNFSAENSV